MAASPSRLPNSPRAFVFDAFGTLFDVQQVATMAEAIVPCQGCALAALWRSKQLEYSWLASLMEQPADFAAVTAQALDYAIAALVLVVAPADRERLLASWNSLPLYPDAAPTLERLAPRPRWILSNGTPAMLGSLVASAELGRNLDGALSVAEVGVFKPSPRVYALACERLALPANEIGFVSANGWDVAGAKAFGFTTFWINRAGMPIERHAAAPDFVIGALADVATLARA